MLQLTLEETAFTAEYTASGEALNAEIEAFRSLPPLPYRASEEEQAPRVAEEKRLKAARDAHNARQKEPVYIRIALKNEINAYIAKNVPGGELSAIIDVAQESLTTFITDEKTIAVAGLLKTVIVTGINAANDPDIHAARARGTYARCKALIEAGFDEGFACQIILAEASRPRPALPSIPSRSKS